MFRIRSDPQERRLEADAAGTCPNLQATSACACKSGSITAVFRVYASGIADNVVLRLQFRTSAGRAVACPILPSFGAGAGGDNPEGVIAMRFRIMAPYAIPVVISQESTHA